MDGVWTSRSRRCASKARGAVVAGTALALAVSALGSVSGCGGKKMQLQPKPAEALSYRLPSTKDAAGSNEPKPLPTSLLARVPERTLGPFLARREGAALAGYVLLEGGARKIATVPLDESGASRGTPRAVATAVGDVETMTVRATGGPRAGFVAAWTSHTERGAAIELLPLTDDGAARGQPVEVARTADDVVWLEIVPTPRGAVCIWAEETRDQSANVLAVALDGDGRTRGVPTPLAKGVRGWQVVPTTMGLGVALVTAAPSARGGPPRAGTSTLTWTKLDADARAVGDRVTVATRANVGLDVDVIRVKDTWLFAWTDRSGFDPQIQIAAVDDAGKVAAPAPLVTSVGGATLVGIAPSGDGAVLAWEESGRSRSGGARLHLEPIERTDAGPKLRRSRERRRRRAAGVMLDVSPKAEPRLVPVADGRGVALLAAAWGCPTKREARECVNAPLSPMVIRFDEALAPIAVEAIRLRDRRRTDLAWGLECSREPCVALTAASSPGGFTEVHAASFPVRAPAYRLPSTPPPHPDAPRALALETVAARESYNDVAAARVGDGTLVAIASTPPAAEDDAAPRRTSDAISVRALDAAGRPRGEPTVITTRALNVGGVAIAAAGSADAGAAVAWVAREGTEPQVHLTLVDRHGKKVRDQLVTTQRGDVSDVAVAWTGRGWLVAWVDGRDGNGEVYAAHVSNDLRVSAHERVTRSPGDASDLSLVVRGDRAWVAFADPRESPHDGFADIYVATLRTSDGKRLEETRVLSTAAHSRSPSLALSGDGDGLILGWIEDVPMGTEPSNSAAYGAMLARLDAQGKLVGEPVRTGGVGPGFPSTIALDARSDAKAEPGEVRAILSRSTRDDLALDVVVWRQNGPARAFPLLGLSGPPSLDVSLALLDGAVFYNDGMPDGGRVRRLRLGWP